MHITSKTIPPQDHKRRKTLNKLHLAQLQEKNGEQIQNVEHKMIEKDIGFIPFYISVDLWLKILLILFISRGEILDESGCFSY